MALVTRQVPTSQPSYFSSLLTDLLLSAQLGLAHQILHKKIPRQIHTNQEKVEYLAFNEYLNLLRVNITKVRLIIIFFNVYDCLPRIETRSGMYTCQTHRFLIIVNRMFALITTPSDSRPTSQGSRVVWGKPTTHRSQPPSQISPIESAPLPASRVV